PARCQTAAGCGRSPRCKASARRTWTPARAPPWAASHAGRPGPMSSPRGSRASRGAAARATTPSPGAAPTDRPPRRAPPAAPRAPTCSSRPRPTRWVFPSNGRRSSRPRGSAPRISRVSPRVSGRVRGTWTERGNATGCSSRRSTAPSARSASRPGVSIWTWCADMAEPPAARWLAERAVAIRDGAVEPDTLARAHDLLIDFLGVAVGGASDAASGTLGGGLAPLGTGDAIVIGAAERLAPAEAALANGAAAHALEMDDTHQGGSIHLGASVFPAAFAAAALGGKGGTALLRAAIAGYEVGARVAMALDPAAHYRRGFHPTGTCRAFAAATAAGPPLDLHPHPAPT